MDKNENEAYLGRIINALVELYNGTRSDEERKGLGQRLIDFIRTMFGMEEE